MSKSSSPRRGTARTAAAVLTVSGMAAGAVAAAAPAFAFSGVYQVSGADSQGLADLTKPYTGGTNGSVLVRWYGNGTSLTVVCQVNNGSQEDGRTQYGHPFTTWDKLSDGTYVYDWYMTTPTVAANGYSPGIPGDWSTYSIDVDGVYGNAGYWGSVAQSRGIAVNNSPTVGSVAWWTNGGNRGTFTVGHVAVVSAVHSDGSIDLAQYNLREDGLFSTLHIPAGGSAVDTSNGHGAFTVYWPDGFIHFNGR